MRSSSTSNVIGRKSAHHEKDLPSAIKTTKRTGNAATRSIPSLSTDVNGMVQRGRPGRISKSDRERTDRVPEATPVENHCQKTSPLKRNEAKCFVPVFSSWPKTIPKTAKRRSGSAIDQSQPNSDRRYRVRNSRLTRWVQRSNAYRSSECLGCSKGANGIFRFVVCDELTPYSGAKAVLRFAYCRAAG